MTMLIDFIEYIRNCFGIDAVTRTFTVTYLATFHRIHTDEHTRLESVQLPEYLVLSMHG